MNAPASDVHAEVAAEGARRLAELGSTPVARRSREEVAGFFSGLELVEPGVMQTHRWHPEPGISTEEYEASALACAADPVTLKTLIPNGPSSTPSAVFLPPRLVSSPRRAVPA